MGSLTLKERMRRAVVQTIDGHPDSTAWKVSVLALDDLPGCLVVIESPEREIGAWTFMSTDQVRDRVEATLGAARRLKAS